MRYLNIWYLDGESNSRADWKALGGAPRPRPRPGATRLSEQGGRAKRPAG